MYYVLTPLPFEEFKKYHVPYILTTAGNTHGRQRDFDSFYSSDLGKEFLSIAPVAISPHKSKKDILGYIARDIAWFGCCYNCPLHIYIMKDKFFWNELDFGFAEYVNVGKCKAMEGPPEAKDYSVKLPRSEMYFEGNMAEVERQVYDVMKFKLTNDRPIVHYIVYTNRIEVCEN